MLDLTGTLASEAEAAGLMARFPVDSDSDDAVASDDSHSYAWYAAAVASDDSHSDVSYVE